MSESISPEMEATIAAKVESGKYATATEVVRVALNEREERERKLAELRAEIQLGIDDLEAGRFVTMTAEELQDMKRRGRERRAAELTGKAKQVSAPAGNCKTLKDARSFR